MDSCHALLKALGPGTLFLSTIALFIWRGTADAGVPSVAAIDYLPGGRMFKLLTRPSQALDMMWELFNQHGYCFYARLGPTLTLSTAFPGDILYVATNVEKFGSTPRALSMVQNVGPGSLFSLPSDLHRRARKSIRGIFSPALLNKFWASLNTAWRITACRLENHLDSVSVNESAAVDVSEIFQTMTVHSLLHVAFSASFSEDDTVAFGKHCSKLLHLGEQDAMRYPFGGSWFGKALGLRKDVDAEVAYLSNVFRKLIQDRMLESAQHKSRRALDLLDAIVGIEGSTEEAMVANCIFFALGGSHSSAAASAWAVYYICSDLKVYQTVQDEIDSVCRDEEFEYKHISQLKYLHQVWKETLRLQPPAGGLLKIAKCDVKLPESGVRVAAGTNVFAIVAVAQRDPNVWKSANEFVPERWDVATGDGPRVPRGAYIPFSAGQKNCPGAFLADFEGVLMLANLFREYDIELAVPREQVIHMSSYGNMSAPGTHDPAGPPGNLRRGLPICVKRRRRF